MAILEKLKQFCNLRRKQKTNKRRSLSLLPHHIIVEILRKMNKQAFISTTKTSGKFAFTAFATEIPLRIPVDKELVIEAIRCQPPTFHTGIQPDVEKLRWNAVETLRMFQFKKVTLVVEESTFYKQIVEEIKELVQLKGYRGSLHLDLLETTQEMLELVKDLRPKECRVTFNETLSTKEMTKIMANSPLTFCDQWEVTNPGFTWTFKDIIGTEEKFSFKLNTRDEYRNSYRRLKDEWLSGAEIKTKTVHLATFVPQEENSDGNAERTYPEFPGKEFFEEFKWCRSFLDIEARNDPKGILIISRSYWAFRKQTEAILLHVETLESFLDGIYYVEKHINGEGTAEKLKEEKWRHVLTKTFEHYWKKTENSAGI